MTFLPIVGRELRVAARQRSTHRARLLAAAFAVGIWLFLSLVSGMTTVPQRAKAVFGVVSVLSLGFAMLAGVILTADCLSEERREGTLGLLFLTDLKGHDVVLGKLVSTSTRAFYGLLGILPVLALPFLMGGMTAGEFWRIALVLMATLFLSLSSGMLISAISRDTRAAMLNTLLVMLLLAGLLPVCWWLHAIVHRTPWLDFLLWPSPAHAYYRAADAYYSARNGPQEYWTSLVTIVGLGVGCLIAASVLLPRIWQEAGKTGVAPEAERAGHRRRFGSADYRAGRRELLNTQPYFWLVTRDCLTRRWLARCFAVFVPVWFFLFAGTFSGRTGTTQICFSVILFLTFALHQIFKCVVAAEVSRRLSEDRESGALELLLVTDLKPSEIVAAQQKAVWVSFRYLGLTLVLLNLLVVWWMVGPDPMNFGDPERTEFSLILLGGIALLFLDVLALTRVGMWAALTTKRHTRALLATLRRVLLPSWLAIFLLYFFAITQRGVGRGEMETIIAVWFFLGVMVDLVVSAKAQSKLGNEFRGAASVGPGETKTAEGNSTSQGMKLDALTIWKRGVRMVRNARHWTPGDPR